jgi:hypothetical protein
MQKKMFLIIILVSLVLAGCGGEDPPQTAEASPTATVVPTQAPTEAATPTPTSTEISTSLLPLEAGPPEIDETIIYGFDSADFPEGFSPLNGMEVLEPELLDHPAMLVSISNFPPSARPQAGLSFTPMVYNFYVGQGMDRFLGVFYGNIPESHLPVIGDCEVNEEIAQFENLILGNQVWLDGNENGRQDPNELGVAGVCVNLLDHETGEVLQSTTTSSNGHFGFDLKSGDVGVIEVLLPDTFKFTQQKQAEDQYLDSDIDPLTGWSNAIQITNENDLSRDAGLVWLSPENSPELELKAETMVAGKVWEDANNDGLQDAGERGVADVDVNIYTNIYKEPIASATTDIWGHYQIEGLDTDVIYTVKADIPKGMYATIADQDPDDMIDSDIDEENLSEPFSVSSGERVSIDAGITLLEGVGPVRSGRIPYKRIRLIYPGSCLAFAGQWAPLEIPLCEPVFNKPEGSDDINANFLYLERLEEVTYELLIPPDGVDYSGNSFSLAAPEGGVEVNEFVMSYNSLNTSKWIYDELAGGWLRYHDMSELSGEFYPSLDRLTQKQLVFNNVILVFMYHDVQNGDATIIDTVFEIGDIGNAWLFRDGKMYDINWAYQYWDWEISTWQSRPLKYIDDDGNSFALHPGNTWVHVVTPWTCIYEEMYGINECQDPSSELEQWIIKFENP